MSIRLHADFNGLFCDPGGRRPTLLCLSHSDNCRDETGGQVELRTGMAVVAFEEDQDEHGRRDDLIASGSVEPAPAWLQCTGSRWVLRIDEQGVRHESELRAKVDES